MTDEIKLCATAPETPVEDLSPAELEAERAAIVAKAKGDWESLTIEELHRIAFIAAALRRRTSGPPKKAKASTSKRSVATEDLMDLF